MRKQIFALAGALFLGNSSSLAVVTVSFAQVGDDVVATWTGILDVSGGFLGDQDENIGFPFVQAFNTSFIAFPEGTYVSETYGGGTATPTTLGGFWDFHPDVTYIGQFGFSGDSVIFPGIANDDTADYTLFDFSSGDYRLIANSFTLSGMGADSFSSTIAYTSNTGDQIVYTTVPESSSIALISLGALGLVIRRKR